MENKKNKLDLAELKVQSFVTSSELSSEQTPNIKGGGWITYRVYIFDPCAIVSYVVSNISEITYNDIHSNPCISQPTPCPNSMMNPCVSNQTCPNTPVCNESRYARLC